MQLSWFYPLLLTLSATRNLEMSFRRTSCRKSGEGCQGGGREGGKALLLVIFSFLFFLGVFSCSLGIEIFAEENQEKLLIILMLL